VMPPAIGADDGEEHATATNSATARATATRI